MLFKGKFLAPNHQRAGMFLRPIEKLRDTAWIEAAFDALPHGKHWKTDR
ncbi:hypothetical protein [Mesorhizobium sp. M7A.F.Ca.US.008.03.1.1]|nr:hypothetical protein [Mesorhizobium sp. M7A.F.Ca.US.008.03.1.1]